MMLLAQKARINAELNSSNTINFPKNIDEKTKQAQLKIFHTRIQNLHNKIQTLKEKINQLIVTNQSLKENINSKKALLQSYENELKKWEKLYNAGLAEEQKIYDLKRKIISLKSEIEDLKSKILANNVQIKNIKEQIKLTQSEYKKELLENLDKINSQLPNLESKIAILEDEIDKNHIKAISNGIVMDMKVHSSGELISPHKQILTIVPKNNSYIVEAMISPLDIDKVHINQKAEIMVASYVDPAAKPIEGKVIYVSPDIIKSPDGKTNITKY
jgi:epimerase transport system membrane fusion protein